MSTSRHRMTPAQLSRRFTAEQLTAMHQTPAVQLAYLWRRIDDAHRVCPPLRAPGAEGIRLAIEECGKTVARLDSGDLAPVKITAGQRRAYDGDRARHEEYSRSALAMRIEGDEAWLKDAREWDRLQRRLRTVGPETLQYLDVGEGF